MTPQTATGIARGAARARHALSALTDTQRGQMLHAMADALQAQAPRLLEANALDMADAQVLAAKGELAPALVHRLQLTQARLAGLASGLRDVAALPDPLHRTLRHTELAPGLVLRQVTAPLGTLLVIFESRPDALPQIAGLCLRSGNAVVLKGGREAARSTAALHAVLTQAIAPFVDPAVLGLVHGRAAVAELLDLHDVFDLVIPRGSNALVHHIQTHTQIPVMGHADGVCHIYLDAAGDLDRAVAIVRDAKTTHPSACNAVETLLVHRDWLTDGRWSALVERALGGVALHGPPDEGAYAGMAAELGLPCAPALRHEWGCLAVTVVVVEAAAAAIEHLHAYGSGHTEAVVTEDAAVAEHFLAVVDAASVFHNASTRFADGYRYGLGAEVGISTGKLHARGPVGLEGLLTTRWLLRGQGDTSAPFGNGARAFTHRDLMGSDEAPRVEGPAASE